jgi:hypothetical protein
MRSKYLNENSGSYVAADGFSEVGGVSKVLTFAGDCMESRLDSATTIYGAGDLIQYCGAFDVTVPDKLYSPVKILVEKVMFCASTVTGTTMIGHITAGTSENEAVNAAPTGAVELFGAGATQLDPEGYAKATSATEADDLNYNSATVTWSAPNIQLPVATKYLYACTTTAINNATSFDAGRWNLVVYYTVI